MNTPQTFTVYLGSSGFSKDIYKNAAIALGQELGKRGKHLVYGGMDAGLMGLLASAALENGADVTGIIPRKIQDSERILQGLTQTILVDDLWDRKKRMFLLADVIVSLPGGFGTLDESLETLYWAYLKIHHKRLILVNIEGYWDPLYDFLQTLPDFNPDDCILVNTIEEVFTVTSKAGQDETTNDPYQDGQHFPHFEAEITRQTDEPIVIDKATIENSYYLICALGLKQLGKHARPIGLFNKNGQFDALITWLHRAAEETFITKKCLKLFDADQDETALKEKLKHQANIHIDLHAEKWG